MVPIPRHIAGVVRLEQQHHFPFPREAVWAVLSRTDWLNRALGLPPVIYQFEPRPEGGATVRAQTRLAGFALRWEERPFEWIEPEFYRVRRLFEGGPYTQAVMGLELAAVNGGTSVILYSEVTPRNAWGRWFTQNVLRPKTLRDLARVLAHVERHLRAETPQPFPRLSTRPVHESALRAGLQALEARGQPPPLVQQLEALLRNSPDAALTHLRPLAVARRWSADPWEVITLFLHATRAGLVDLRWEVLCPNCRSSRSPAITSLDRLKRTSHCDVCQIAFDAEFDRSVELKFAVNPAIRPRIEQTYCLAGPGGRPHIVAQVRLEPGEARDWPWPARTYPVRLRSPQVKAPLLFEPETRPAGVRVEVGGFQATLAPVPPPDNGVTRLENPNPFPVVLSLERLGWGEDILTAARVTNWQEFRDLFSTQVISPTEQITVGAQVVLFTDLRGSTALYQGIGDGPAYALVRDHFAILFEAIRAHRGGVVKTIGDAVMGCFSRLDEALEAVRHMHRRLPAAHPALAARSALKSSLHLGPCLAVNANERLDFFGTTINLAARMVECCRGGDLTFSDELRGRPELAAFLKTIPREPELLEMQFRGFESPHRVWRIEMDEHAR